MGQKVEILTIGDELLIGQTTDSNASFISKHLNQYGYEVVRRTTIGDEKDRIHKAVDEAFLVADIVVLTGGLGPTHDDMTKQSLAEYFDCGWKRDDRVEGMVRKFFEQRGLPILQSNLDQALVPDKAEAILNPNGSAPALWMAHDNKVVIAFPGVPYEMKYLLKEEVLPRLIEDHPPLPKYQKTVLTAGIGESFLAEKIRDWEDQVKESGIALAYLPSPGLVKIRLSAQAKNERQVRELIDGKILELKDRIPEYVFGEDEQSLEEAVGRQLKGMGQTVGTAESCTGGNIAHLFTSVPGSSAYFSGSVVAYANQIKQDLLSVPSEMLEKEGAVSKGVVEQMAIGAKDRLNVDWALATSGIMGPTGGSEEKPVGTVWIAVAGDGGCESKKLQFSKQRQTNIILASRATLDLFRKILLKSN